MASPIGADGFATIEAASLPMERWRTQWRMNCNAGHPPADQQIGLLAQVACQGSDLLICQRLRHAGHDGGLGPQLLAVAIVLQA
jgi:hypothetical protein